MHLDFDMLACLFEIVHLVTLLTIRTKRLTRAITVDIDFDWSVAVPSFLAQNGS